MASQNEDNLRTRLAAALLRPGADSRACLWVRAHVPDGEPVDLGALVEGLGIDAGERSGLIHAAETAADRAIGEARTRGFQLVILGEEGYPPRLANICDPPLVLWSRGTAPLDGSTVAIVGSRTASHAGLTVARDLADALARRGYSVVSGMAAGVDGAAHAAALAAGGPTVGVLGCGVDVVYPPGHRALTQDMVERGRLVSEFAPGVTPRPYHFPLRNRIISGLSRAVVLIEAGHKSGSLITARMAAGQGRDVMAVPGSVPIGKSAGCHALIRDGARLVEGVRDVIEELEGVSWADLVSEPANVLPLGALEAALPRGEAMALDELAAATGRPAAQLLAELTQLELEGRVSRAAGGFVRP